MQGNEKKLRLVIDGLNTFFRHFAANPAMTQNGEQAGGVVGFIWMLTALCEQFNPHEVHIIWEGGGSHRRRDLFPDYKCGRKPQRLNRYYEDDIPETVENHLGQVSFLTIALKHLPIHQHYIKDCEADDVIGYLAKYVFRHDDCVIVSSDKDYYQLVDNRISVWSPGQKKLIRAHEIIEKVFIHPKNMLIARAVIGDPADNIDGVTGAGFKVMSKRFPSLTEAVEISLDSLFSECQEKQNGSKVKLFSEILDNEAKIRRNFKLMQLDVSNLSASQVQQIEHSAGLTRGTYNRLGFLAALHKFGLVNLDPQRLFLSMSLLNKR